MAYYHELITEKSWFILQELRKQFHFILIGGWAVYLYTRNLKSKDIDFLCAYEELERIKAVYPMTKNERLKKYEIRSGEIQVDIYVPFYSELGVPSERISEYVTNLEGFVVPQKELLLILKQKAWFDRGHSLKGEKDKIDIIGLLTTGIQSEIYYRFLKDFGLVSYVGILRTLLEQTTSVSQLNLNAHQFSRWKKTFFSEFRFLNAEQ